MERDQQSFYWTLLADTCVGHCKERLRKKSKRVWSMGIMVHKSIHLCQGSMSSELLSGKALSTTARFKGELNVVCPQICHSRAEKICYQNKNKCRYFLFVFYLSVICVIFLFKKIYCFGLLFCAWTTIGMFKILLTIWKKVPITSILSKTDHDNFFLKKKKHLRLYFFN